MPDLTAPPEIFDNANAMDYFSRMVCQCALRVGVWPDGAPWSSEERGWERHMFSDHVALPDGEEALRRVHLDTCILDACNSIAWQWRLKTGRQPDGAPATDEDPAYWSFSANYNTGTKQRAEDESPGPYGLPWWLIRRKPPD